MGVNIIRVGTDPRNLGPRLTAADLAKASFQRYTAGEPPLSIWLMSLGHNRSPFPWWPYAAEIDADVQKLSAQWRITSAQALFDLLFLNRLSQLGGKDLFAIFTGNTRTNGWRDLEESDRKVYMRGQNCVYHLEAAQSKRITVNWVPFFQPQSLVRAPNFENLWRLFLAKRDENDGVNCLTLFSLKEVRSLPNVINLLVKKDEQRSEKLADLVDWFSVYSSPLKADIATSAILYTRRPEVMAGLAEFERRFTEHYERAKADLLADTQPTTVFKILTRSLVL